MKSLATVVAVLLALTAPVRAADIVGVSETPIAIDASNGELVRLSRAASTVFVADPEIADVQVKSPRLIYVFGKKPGETTIYAVDENEQVLLSRRVIVTHNVTKLRAALREMLPDANIDVRSVEGSVVLTGDATASEIEDARKLARKLVLDDDSLVTRIAITAPNQVQLRVRVAEVSRDVLKNLGFNWDAFTKVGNFALGLFTGNPVLAAGTTFLTEGAREIQNRTGGTNSVFGSFRSNKLDINGLVDALNTEGLISVLAEPSLTAVSGQTATFLAGGEFPIIVPDGNNSVTIQFKQFGVSLAFKPTLINDNHINLMVNPEVSQLSAVGAVQLNGFTVPALTTRRANTTVELGSGQSFVIAGLIQNNTTHDVSKLPGLGEIPVLGALFRSDKFKRNESELVIIVTPYIVRPVSTQMLAAPTDGLVPPTDIDRVVYGRSHGTRATSAPRGPVGAEGQGLVGSAGYVLD